MKTSVNKGHSHFWEVDDEFTSITNGHVHKIDFSRKIALRNGKKGHIHKLLLEK